jgi:hypothetical protein
VEHTLDNTKPKIQCVSIDGTDGVGKTTLIESLKEKFNVVVVPKFYHLGMVPMGYEERKKWFLSARPQDSMRIYALSHRYRILLCQEYREGNHYIYLRKDQRPKLIVLDRGVISIEAFIYASLRMYTGMSDHEIHNYIAVVFRGPEFEQIFSLVDKSIVLSENTLDYLEIILKRRNYEEHEKNLIKYQAEYIKTNLFAFKRTYKLSPILNPNELVNLASEIILENARGQKCI